MTLETAFDAAGEGAAAFNRTIDISRRNLNASFDLAKSLAGADLLGLRRQRAELVAPKGRLHLNHIGKAPRTSSKVTDDTSKPIKAQMAGGAGFGVAK
jgi:hypothetical protein